MRVFLNGEFVPQERAVISVLDRGFLYGDGVFETMRVLHRSLFRWDQHFERLAAGATFLGIPLPYTDQELRASASRLISQNRLTDGLLRLTLSRGIGLRGYSPRGAARPTVTMTVHPSPPSSRRSETTRLITSSFRLPAGEVLAQFKTCNKLAQIMARAHADQLGASEALLLNTNGYVVEGSSSNLFWIEGDRVCTPPLPSGILSGVTRAVVLELCDLLEIRWREAQVKPKQLSQMAGVFVTSSAVGVTEAQSLDGEALNRSPLTRRLRGAYAALLRKETQALAAIQTSDRPARGK